MHARKKTLGIHTSKGGVYLFSIDCTPTRTVGSARRYTGLGNSFVGVAYPAVPPRRCIPRNRRRKSLRQRRKRVATGASGLSAAEKRNTKRDPPTVFLSSASALAQERETHESRRWAVSRMYKAVFCWSLISLVMCAYLSLVPTPHPT